MLLKINDWVTVYDFLVCMKDGTFKVSLFSPFYINNVSLLFELYISLISCFYRLKKCDAAIGLFFNFWGTLIFVILLYYILQK